MRKARIGVIGCGDISERYLANMQLFESTEVVAVADLVEEKARRRAEQFRIPVVCRTNEELIARKDVDIVVNLTIPVAHAEVSKAALRAGKHVYTEKPLAAELEAGSELVELARELNLRLSCAPDTFLGASLQTSRKLIDDGWIGRPFGATCHLIKAGPESWHPDPAFLYHEGAGPLFDSGPYFVSGLVYLLGPVKSVTCAGEMTYAERVITSQPHHGEIIHVEVPTFVAGLLTFASGAVATMLLTTDVPYSRYPDPRQNGHGIEVYGTQGTLSVPSPCYFDGAIFYRRTGMIDWAELPRLYTYTEDSRGIGVADMASAVLFGRPPRASAEMSYHIHEVLHRLDESQRGGGLKMVESTFERTEPLESTLRVGEIGK
jgi:predicted dehydrogenase